MSVQPKSLFQTRPMTAADVPAVLRIERASYGFPWTERIFKDCLRVGYRCFVAADMAGTVVGYALLSVVVDESHVLNLCVDARHRRQGIARLLLERMLHEAQTTAVHTMLLEVRPSNRGARRLYAAYGFERIATRPNYYPSEDGREDAYLLSRRVQLPHA